MFAQLNKVKVHEISDLRCQNQDIIICDPCYLFDNVTQDDVWQDFCKIMFDDEFKSSFDKSSGRFVAEQAFFGKSVEIPPDIDDHGILEYNGAMIYYMGTAHGDGCYSCKGGGRKCGHQVGVDAGMICAVTLEDAKKVNPKLAQEMVVYSSAVYIPDFSGWISLDGERGILTGSHGLTIDTDPEFCDNCGEEMEKDYHSYEMFCCEDCHDEYYGEGAYAEDEDDDLEDYE